MNSDLTIHDLVNLLVQTFNDNDKEVFLLDRENNAGLQKNVECFYLSALCSEFKIFSELDLILISYACEVSIVVDFAVPFVHTNLPYLWEQRVIVQIGVDGSLELSCTIPLKYTPGRLSDAYNFVFSAGLPSSVAFPKALKESSQAIEEDSAVVEEVFEEYKGEVKYSWDIDGMCGIIPDHIVNPFMTNINVNIDIKNNPQIYTKKYVHKNLAIKVFTHIRLGSLSSRWGDVSLFIIFNEGEGGNYLSLFLKNVAVLLERPLGDNSEIKGRVESHEVPGFLYQLKCLYPGCSFFIESYGTKNAISNKLFYAVFTKLYEIFDVSLVPELTFDIALTAVPQEFKCLFISFNTFKRLHVRPNYKLALCNLIRFNYK